ncbi:TraR/DksA C4-type zinc finger protein [Desulfocurvibacter africanus]|uniref:TraR/DksA C4-type zinc finger protein n=1 Tax=Desulfocurvibacter africanus TaxID=873 RepID=UPI0003FA0FF5|nr:TraR/DksA C4-type zinc finger protein [Desulfocurvibacter africanus]
MDIADIAAEREYLFRQEALARACAGRRSGPSRETCAECGEPIPEARRKAVPGVTHCVICQEVRER